MNSKTVINPESAIELTEDEAKQLGIDPNLEEQHGDLKTVGMWSIPVSYKAIAVSSIWDKEQLPLLSTRKETTIYGVRTMTKVRQSGYCLEGWVSIGGKKYSAFTSSQLFKVNGKLLDVATIHARIK